MISYEKFCEQANMTPPKEVYETAAKSGEFENVDFLQEEYLQRIQKEYRLFNRYFEQILAAAEEIRNNEFLRTYVNLHRVAAFNPVGSRMGLIKQTADKPTLCYAPLFGLLAHIDKAEEEMCRRGVEKEIRLAVHSVHEKRISRHEDKRGFPAFNDSDWFYHFLIPDIYPIGNLEFEITPLWCKDSVFRAADGTIVALRDFVETAEAFVGKRLLRGGVTEDMVLSKSEYSLFLEPGDDVISVHIPGRTPLDDAFCVESYKRAWQFFKEHYPDRPAKAMLCRSWLMDPALADILNENSKIVSFQNRYRRFAADSNGREVFVFVFDGYPEDLNTLPEDTSLLRALKKRYLQDDPIYAYFGILDLE